MKKLAPICVLIIVLAFAATAFADQQTETKEILLSKLIKDYAMKTKDWGNVYFNIRQLHALIHAAAQLRPVDLGTFVSDTGVPVHVKALGYDKGVATLLVAPVGIDKKVLKKAEKKPAKAPAKAPDKPAEKAPDKK